MNNKVEFQEKLKLVQKPGRYTGEEWNIKKKNPREVKIKVALVFPDSYEVGMSYLGHKILYHVLNRQPSILAERVYAPWIDFERVLRDNQIPLYSLENKIPLYDFDIIGFSLLYELNYSNILTILDLGKIPLLSKQRDLNHPLVIAGGPAAFNPEPVSDFFDLFLLGDGEKAFIKVTDRYFSIKKRFHKKKTVLKSMTQIKGVYVPAFYRPYLPSGSKLYAEKPIEKVPSSIKKNVLFSFEKKDIPYEVIVPNIRTVFDRASVEVARGCAQNCRFCQARNVYFPLRNKNPGMVMEELIENLNSTGYEEASLSALSVGDYPDLDKMIVSLMKEFVKKKISLSLSSLRPKFLTDKVTESIIRVKKTGFTLVPEAGTERLRRVINKKLKEEEIFEAVSSAFSKGWRKLKLYFMVGLPTEREEDIEGIVSLTEKIVQLGYQILKRPPQINLSVSSFIPKPHTPFQWVRMNSIDELKSKHEYLRTRLKKYRSVWFKDHSVESAVLEGIFSRGDRRLNSVLLRAWKRGVRFDGWTDQFDFSIWDKSFKEQGLDYQIYLSSLSQNSVLPWEHIETGVKKSYLKKELKEGFREKWTDNCEKRDCRDCLGCFFPERKNKVISTDILPKHLSDHQGRKKQNREIRYRLFYKKERPAKYLSHIDLSQIIQRTLRRAGIQVKYTQGFHPKMQISFPPAVGLGMEARKEVLEFRSQYLFSNQRFLSRINKFFPKGIKALSLEKVHPDKPSLSKDIKSIVYSLDLNHKQVITALEEKMNPDAFSVPGAFDFIEKKINKESLNELKRVELDKKQNKVLIEFMFSPQKPVKIKSIIGKILEIEYPNFVLTREKINFRSS